jgi:transcriptional regulator with XRE-family HTH domain
MTVSTSSRETKGQDRAELLNTVQHLVATGELTLGDAVRFLRAGFLRKTRPEFAKLLKVSEPALAQIESNKGNPTLDTLNLIFKPFGLRIGLVANPTSLGTYPALTEDAIQKWKEPIQQAVRANRKLPKNKPSPAKAEPV